MKNSREAAEYLIAKRRFRNILVELMDSWRASGWPEASICPSIDLMIDISTEEFLNDPDQHFPQDHLIRFKNLMVRDYMGDALESRGIMPAGSDQRIARSCFALERAKLLYLDPTFDLYLIGYHRYPGESEPFDPLY